MAAKGSKVEGRAGKIYRVTAADGLKISTREMVGRLRDGDYVLCFKHETHGYRYSLITFSGGTIYLYPKEFRFHAPAIGTPTIWQPNEDEPHLLWGMQSLRGEGSHNHPLFAEMEQARMEEEARSSHRSMYPTQMLAGE